jgi:Tol biopolymer transport system component
LRLTTGPGPDESPSVASDGSIAFLNSQWRYLLQAHDVVTGRAQTLVTQTTFLWGVAIAPDGRDVAFSQAEEDGSWHLWSVPVAGGTARRLTSSESGELYPRWSPDGAFVMFHTWNLPRRFGRVPRGGGGLEWMSFGEGEQGAFADLSPDGRRVAFSRAEGPAEHIYVADLRGGRSTRLTPSPGAVPKWAPDGTGIAFSGSRHILDGIFTIGSNGTGQRRLTQTGRFPDWWPDGKSIGYVALDEKGNEQVRVVSSEGGAPRPLVAIRLVGANHTFCVSPNGRTLVVDNSEHVSEEIWLLKRAYQR